jgi:hypothetical protein
MVGMLISRGRQAIDREKRNCYYFHPLLYHIALNSPLLVTLHNKKDNFSPLKKNIFPPYLNVMNLNLEYEDSETHSSVV